MKEDLLNKYLNINVISAYENEIKIKKKVIYHILEESIKIIADNKNNFTVANSVLENFTNYMKKVYFALRGTEIFSIYKAGDFHNENKCALIIKVKSGKVVIKPQNVQIEEKYYSFMSEIFKTVNKEFFKPEIKYCEGIKICKFIESTPIMDKKKVSEEYGMLLAISYLIGMGDLHKENLIFHNDNVVPIDVETIFQFNKKTAPKNAIDMINDLLNKSVMTTGMLPFWLNFKYNSTPTNIFNMDIKLNEKYVILGFNLIIDKILRNKNFYIKAIYKYFGNVEFRYVVSHTFKYDEYIKLSVSKEVAFSSEYCQNQILYKFKKYSKTLGTFINEFNDMKKLDIPYFIAYSNSNDIKGTKNIIKDFFEKTPIVGAIENIKKLDVNEKNFQNKLIKLSFLTLRQEEFLTVDNNLYYYKKKDSYLQKAIEIGDILVNDSIVFWDECTWIGNVIGSSEENKWQVSCVGHDVYNGNLGISIYLIELYKKTFDIRYLSTAVKSYNTSYKEYMENSEFDKNQIVTGFYTGLSGLLYVTYLLSQVKKEEMYYKKLLNILIQLKYNIKNDKIYDIISGNASCLLVLKYIYDHIDIENIKCILKILINEIKCEIKKINTKSIKYHGFAHGLSGVGYCIENNNIKKKFNNIESKNFDTIEKNWIYSDSGISCKGWCHGSPGILISRMGINKKEENYALEYTTNHCFNLNLTLCHGDLGNYIILKYYFKHQKKFNELEKLEKKFDELYINKINTLDVQNMKNYGLLGGLSGIGYALLDMEFDLEGMNILCLK